METKRTEDARGDPLVRFDVVFRGGTLDGHATQRFTLPEFIEVPASTGATLRVVRYVRRPSMLPNEPVVYELEDSELRN